MDEYPQRVEVIGNLAAAFPSVEVTDQTIKTYVWALKDLSLAILKAAIDRCATSARFFPSIAEIRENAGAVTTEGKDGQHPDNCACFGTGMIQFKENGYNQVRRCDGVIPKSDDDVNSW